MQLRDMGYCSSCVEEGDSLSVSKFPLKEIGTLSESLRMTEHPRYLLEGGSGNSYQIVSYSNLFLSHHREIRVTVEQVESLVDGASERVLNWNHTVFRITGKNGLENIGKASARKRLGRLVEYHLNRLLTICSRFPLKCNSQLL